MAAAVQIRPVLNALVEELKAAGFSGAHYDPEKVSLPGGVWVQPRTVHDYTLAGGGTLTVWLYLLAGVANDEDNETDDHLSKLDDSLQGIAEMGLALADTDDQMDLAAALLLPGYTTPLPAYRLAVDIDL
jgi:hypothetical protein